MRCTYFCSVFTGFSVFVLFLLLFAARLYSLSPSSPISLVCRYKGQRFYWETVVTARKVSVVALSVFGKELGAERQSHVALLLLLTCIVLEILGEPFREPTSAHRVLKRLELSALLVEWGTLWCGLMIFRSGPKSEGLNVFLTVSVIFANAILMLWLVLVLLLSYLQHLDSRHFGRLRECLGMRRHDSEAGFQANSQSSNFFDTVDNVMDNPLRDLGNGTIPERNTKAVPAAGVVEMVLVNAQTRVPSESTTVKKETTEDAEACPMGTGAAESIEVRVTEPAERKMRKFTRYETAGGDNYYVEVGTQDSMWYLPPDGEVVAE